MTRSSIDALDLSQKVIKVLTVLNVVLGAGILTMFVLSFVSPQFLFRAIGMRAAADPPTVMTMARVIMVLGFLSIPLTHLILKLLRAIVETVQPGPFIIENAERLRTMGWSLFGLEALHFGVGVAARVLSLAGQPVEITWNFSATRWLAVLMLFVLARVFEQGARMRADLEGTV